MQLFLCYYIVVMKPVLDGAVEVAVECNGDSEMKQSDTALDLVAPLAMDMKELLAHVRVKMLNGELQDSNDNVGSGVIKSKKRPLRSVSIAECDTPLLLKAYLQGFKTKIDPKAYGKKQIHTLQVGP